MSVSSEITRLQKLRNELRTKLVGLGIAQLSDDLEACVTSVEGIANNGAVSGTISTKSGTYTVPAGYHNGSGTVGIISTEQSKIISENIKSGVIILGVEGTYSGEKINLQSKTVTPAEELQEITSDEGYDALSKVVVNAIPDSYAQVTNVTAVAADVLANKIFVDSTGKEAAGTMVNNGAIKATIDGLTALSYTVPSGYHNGTGTVTLTDDIETALAAI